MSAGQNAEPFPVMRGTVIRRSTAESREIGIVRGPALRGLEVVHGWIVDPPDVGTFTLTERSWDGGFWRLATKEEADRVRTLFLAHVETWGPDSIARIAEEIPQ